MNNEFRMLANPYRLSKDYQDSDAPKSSFSEGLRKVIEDEYQGLYISPQVHKEIRTSIDDHIQEYIRSQVVNEVVDGALEKAIKDVLSQEEAIFEI
tara:strand:+ start:369 stop:656 length:288 start_codon:yes stop_codon:yes gene_type:complete